MNYTVLSKPTPSTISLTEAKRQLSRFDSDDDLHIDMVIQSAIDMAESYTNRFFNRAQLQVSVAEKGSYILPMSDNINVVSVKDSDDNDVAYTLSGETITTEGAATIIYDTGMSEVGPRIKMACLRIVSDLYQHREDDVFGAVKSMVSTTAYDVLDSIKRPLP